MTVPKFPPICGECRKDLPRADMVGVGYDPCPDHPDARVVYRSQVDGSPVWSYPRSEDPGWGEWAKDGS